MAQVVPHIDAIHATNTDVLTVTFGTPYWAKVWLEETQAPMQIWLDPAKQSYETYGMTASVWASWGPKNLWYYAKALARGEKMLGNRGDTNQLGGDFIVDSNGIVRFAYPSADPTDRPPVSQLLDVLHKIGR